jgi:hypothetical protein
MKCGHYEGYIMGCGDNQYCGICRMDELQAEIARLQAEVAKANARERPAFMAGLLKGHGEGIESYAGDPEQDWQQYRCQDDTDWRAVKESERTKGAGSFGEPETEKGRDG